MTGSSCGLAPGTGSLCSQTVGGYHACREAVKMPPRLLYKELWLLQSPPAGREEGSLRGRAHLAVALEESAVLDHELRGDEGGLDLRAGQELDALASVHPPADRAPDGDDAAVDVRVHLARLADDQGVVGDDLPLEPPVDAQGVAEAELAQELRPLVHEAVEVLGRGALELDHPCLPRKSPSASPGRPAPAVTIAQGARRSAAEPPPAKLVQQLAGQAQHPGAIRDGGAPPPHPPRHLLLGQPELRLKPVEGLGLLEGGELLALDVLDEGELEEPLVRHVA